MKMAENGTDFVRWELEDPPQFHPWWFEKTDYESWKEFSADNWPASFQTALVFVATIFTLKWWMRTRKPFELKGLVFLWNMGLGIFSLLGAVRIAQELLALWALPDGLHKSLCVRTGLNQPAAFYCVCFALTKFIELGDTLFIVLRKKQLLFFHWYHHIVTMILVWKVFPFSEPISRYFGFMSYGVHSIMYPYYALRVLDVKVPKAVAILITCCELLQFILGLALNAYSINLPDCARDPASYRWINAVYGSFFILFAHFFYDRYLTPKKKTS